MAFSAVTHRGFGFEKVSDLTWVISPASNIVVGKIAFVHAVTDNTATTSGATTTHTSIVDNADGGAWAKVYERTAPGTPAAGTGTTHSLWWKLIATQIGTGNTITLTVTANAAAKIINVFEVTITGSTIQVANDGTPSGFQEGSASSASVATSGMTSQEYLHIGALARESDTTTYTADADYTNLTSPAGQVTTGGGAATNQGSFVATRIATLTGDTWAVSWTGATDIAAALVAFEEVTSGVTLTGTLFTSAPTFFTGVITPGTVTLAGSLFVNTVTFPTGAIALTFPLTGTLFVNAPTFFTGVVTPGTVTLAGTLFSSPPAFFTGAVNLGSGPQSLTGTLFVNAPTFFTGVVTSDQILAGILFTSPPSFPLGVVSQVGATQNLTGTLYVKPVTFFVGRVSRAVPTGLLTNEIGVMGHSNVGTFIQYYRSISARDLLTPTNHGGYDVSVWGNPSDPSYAAAWAKLDDDEPVGGYRAFWVMLGFRNTHTNEAQNQAWADHIAARLATDYPVEYTWWSVMNTYFTTNPGDGDSEDLVALDPWDTNPTSLTTWKSSDTESEMSWNNTKYAIAQGYADDYGPWINLTDAETDTDDRHPTEAPGDPVPNGASHGGEVLLAFFESGAQGFAGNLFTVTPTFFTGVVTPGTATLAGVLHVHAPTFFGGAVDLAGTVTLTGVLHVHAPTFPTGTVTAGVVALTGTLFSSPPVFFTGTVASTFALTGTLYVHPPTFFVGVTLQDQPLTGTLFVNPPTFFVGVASNAGALLGTLYVHAPVFFVGIVGLGAPSFWSPNPVGYTLNPVAYTVNPVAYTKVNGSASPWGATLSGHRFENHPTFLVGTVS